MLDMGFIHPVKQIAAAIGPRRQTALFSATMAKEIAELAKGLLNDPVRVEAQPPATTVGTHRAARHPVGLEAEARRAQQAARRSGADDACIIFSRTKHGADRVTKNLVDRRA